MSDDFQSGGCAVEVAGAEQNVEELSASDLKALITGVPDSSRPEWMTTRFPVSMEEFEQLNALANEPSEEPFAAFADQTTADADVEVEYQMDTPEGEIFASEPGANAPPVGISFAGISQTAYRPPDCTIAVGLNHVMVAVNTDYAIYNKAGGLLVKRNLSFLFAPVLPSGATLFDPVLAYDHYTNRWIVVVAARRGSPAGSWLMVGVSQGANPLGAYWIWATDGIRSIFRGKPINDEPQRTQNRY